MAKTYLFWEPLSDNILQERDESGALVAEYTAEPGLYGNVISQRRSGVESQFHFDAVGSTLALTDDDQQITDTRAYTAFGETTESSGLIFPFQYIGKKEYYFDVQTEQTIARQRIYDGVNVRWVSPEPRHLNFLRQATNVRREDFNVPSQMSHYLYCWNAPTSFFDPSGNVPIPPRQPNPRAPLPRPAPTRPPPGPSFPRCAGRIWRSVSFGQCQYRTNNPDAQFQAKVNGCTAPAVGDHGDWDFTPACNEHDLCYQRCGADQKKCDDAVLAAWLKICDTADLTEARRQACVRVAHTYYYYLRAFGVYSYEWLSQDKACEWKPCCCPGKDPFPDVPNRGPPRV